MSLPVKRAFTGPTSAITLAVKSVSDSFTISSQPGMHWARISGSLSASQTFSRGAAMRYSPVMSMGLPPPPL